MDFKTSKQNQMDGIVATLERLYSGRPIGSPTLGLVFRMEHAQVLKYLHQAKDAGRVTPILNVPGGSICGWVPASATATESLAEQNATRAASAVKQIARKGRLVATSAVARHLEVSEETVGRWLKYAEHMGLVLSETKRGWKLA